MRGVRREPESSRYASRSARGMGAAAAHCCSFENLVLTILGATLGVVIANGGPAIRPTTFAETLYDVRERHSP